MGRVLRFFSGSRVAFAAATIAVAGGSVALAASHGTGTRINACAQKRGGALRVRARGSRCHANERTVSWNVTGPRGPRGLRGLLGQRGLQGVKGDTGPSSARIAYGASGPEVATSGSYTTVLTMPSLALGTWEVTGTATINFSALTHGVDLQCGLFGGVGPLQESGYDQSTGPDQNDAPEGPTLTPQVTYFVTLHSPTDISLGCRAQTSDTGVTWEPSTSEIVARAVGAVSSQAGTTPP